MIKNYTKKPITIQAIQYNGENINEITDFIGVENINFYESESSKNWYIKTLEGNMMVSNGDYVIRGIKGEFYPCKSDIFEMTYDFEELNDTLTEEQIITITMSDKGSSITTNGLNLFEVLGLLQYHKEWFLAKSLKRVH
jgi:hypothetical protein